MTIKELIENRLKEVERALNNLKKELETTQSGLEYDINRMLKDEKYRIITAIKLHPHALDKELAKHLGMNERTFYRKKKHYKIKHNLRHGNT